MSFLLSDYDYNLPPRLIAQQPIESRDQSRLLVLDRKAGKWEHRIFADLPEYVRRGDLLVANNTKVLKARLEGLRLLDGEREPGKGGKIEFLLLEEKEPNVWEGAFHASVKHRPGVRFWIPTPDGKGLRGELLQGASASPYGTVIARFDRDPVTSGAGSVPLPHYIEREAGAGDEARYQTVYAKEPGSAAAPTAGLHFTESVIEQLKKRGAEWAEVTLHVGLGTFRPVKTDDIRQHQMHEERYEITPAVAARINKQQRLFAVGTTSVRTLESAWHNGRIEAGVGRTSIFIYPGGHTFRVVDAIITNFHLPKSTLLMLVCAFAGRELTLAAYEDAVREEYRFFSYGDAMLIL